MNHKKINLLKYFEFFVYAVIIGSVAIAYTNYSISKKYFDARSEESLENNSKKIADTLDKSIMYVERIASLIASRIIQHDVIDARTTAQELEFKPMRNDDKKYDVFTWAFFDFIAPNGNIISNSKGVIKNPIQVTSEKRSYFHSARITPWKIIVSKSDIGIISKEKVIPVGFGITNKKNEFVGIISMGMNVEKIRIMLENVADESLLKFILLNKDNSIITASRDFDEKFLAKISAKISNFTDLDRNKLIKYGDENFLYLPIPHYPELSLMVSFNKKTAQSQFLSEITPNILNTIYLTIFFLVFIFFFKTKLLNPVISLSKLANKISHGDTNVKIPESHIVEINSLSRSIEMVRNFIERQKEETAKLSKEKIYAEKENENKTEFLSSTVHELKNIIAGIIGLAEIIKSNLSHKIETNQDLSEEEIKENKSFLEDIIKLGEELSGFIHDVIDINQAKNGNFNIEEENFVDVKDIILRSIKLLKIRSIKSKKHITSHFIKSTEQDFLVKNLDPRRVKQIFVNLISNSIKYSKANSKIDVRLEVLDEEVSEILRDSVIKNLNQNSDIDIKRKAHLLKIIRKHRPKTIITIKDQGEGMSEEEVKIAMQKYGRIAHCHEEFVDSTGLGLPIVKHLVEMQGGMMTIKSEKGVGTEVKIIF